MKKIIIIAIIIIIIATIILISPKSKEISLTTRCYDCSLIEFPISEQTFDKLDFIDINYELKITQNSFFIIDINGYISIQNTKYDIGDYIYDRNNNWHYCSLKDKNEYVNYMGLTFSEDFNFIRILYNDNKFNKNEKGMWFGPCNSHNELVEVLKAFKIKY